MKPLLDSMLLLFECFKSSMGILFGSLCLIAMLQCIEAMIIGNLMEIFLEDPNQPLEARQLVYKYYGTFTTTMLTMWEVLLGDWIVPTRVAVDHVSEWFSLWFIIHRLLLGFALLNVVSAMFVHQTMQVAEQDIDLQWRKKRNRTSNTEQRLRELFPEDGTISLDEFAELVHTEEWMCVIDSLGLGPRDALALFEMMDVNHSGDISFDEFIAGSARLRGKAKNIDMHLLLADSKRLSSKLDELQRMAGSPSAELAEIAVSSTKMGELASM
ncbi:unnamed protein product [Polarella glacialis]|uniref:EF-hand domain-containing protein n=1 Tax=Polarella glacialis TaxID=89957 RepID=A0A813ID26_POLGL|nr:unnamed protein product [Polarella glacialis]